jgi:hypothetical protein
VSRESLSGDQPWCRTRRHQGTGDPRDAGCLSVGSSSPGTGAGRGGGPMSPSNAQPSKRSVEIITQGCAGSSRRCWQGAHHHERVQGQGNQPGPHQVPQSALHPVPDHRATDRATHHEADPRAGSTAAQRSVDARHMHHNGPTRCSTAPPHRRRELIAAGQSTSSGQQWDRPANASGRQLGATLAPTGRNDRAAGAGTHAQPEPVGPRTATVVRLERALALAHGCRSPGTCSSSDAGCSAARDLPLSPGQARMPAGGGRQPEPRRPTAVPSKHTSGVTVRATRRYIGGACLHGVLVAAPQTC